MIDEKKLIAAIEAYAKDKTAKGCWYDRLWGLRMAIEIINQQPKVGEWIPCSKRLPKKGGKDIWYLVNVKDGRKPYEILNYHTEYKMFCDIERDRFLGDHIRGTAYMWQPLPEPWRGERENERNNI